MAVPNAEPSYGYRKRNNVGHGDFVNGAIYGDYGTGKTYLGGTVDRVIQKCNNPKALEKLRAPEGLKVRYATLFANAEQGEDGLPPDCLEIIIKDITDYASFGRLYDFLKLHIRYVQKKDYDSLVKLQKKYFAQTDENFEELWIFKAVIIDSLTEIQKYCLYQLIGLSADSKLDEEPEYMQQRQWGTALEMILLMVRNFRSLPIHTIFIIQQMEDQDEKKKLFFRPALQGQAKSSILGFFDFVGYYRMAVSQDAKRRRLYLTPIGAFKAKHRFPSFNGDYIDDPDFGDILAARKGKGD